MTSDPIIESLIEIAYDAWDDQLGVDANLRRVLAAMLAATPIVSCETCGGTGDVGPRDERGEGIWKDCLTCGGSGTRPGPRLALVEQVGWTDGLGQLYNELPADDIGSPAMSPFIAYRSGSQ